MNPKEFHICSRLCCKDSLPLPFVPSTGAAGKLLTCLLLGRGKVWIIKESILPTQENFHSFLQNGAAGILKGREGEMLGHSRLELWLRKWYPKRQFNSVEGVQLVIMMTMMIADTLRGFTSHQAPSFYRHHHLAFTIKLGSFAVNIIALKSQDFGSNPSSATS